jgi:PTH1 family peptidyl-tRNA hydrolase
MRIGVGHPGNKDMVSNWVLNKFHPTDKKYIDSAYYRCGEVLDLIFNHEFSKAQKILHTN